MNPVNVPFSWERSDDPGLETPTELHERPLPALPYLARFARDAEQHIECEDARFIAKCRQYGLPSYGIDVRIETHNDLEYLVLTASHRQERVVVANIPFALNGPPFEQALPNVMPADMVVPTREYLSVAFHNFVSAKTIPVREARDRFLAGHRKPFGDLVALRMGEPRHGVVRE